jgi:hypothetical protein
MGARKAATRRGILMLKFQSRDCLPTNIRNAGHPIIDRMGCSFQQKPIRSQIASQGHLRNLSNPLGISSWNYPGSFGLFFGRDCIWSLFLLPKHILPKAASVSDRCSNRLYGDVVRRGF